ncbi:MAG: PAS domain-containing protein [Candidatus Nanopelagicales bacterium]
MATGGELVTPAGSRHFRELAEHVADVAYIASRDRILAWVAPTVEWSLGWTPEQLVGTPLLDLVHPEDLQRIHAAREQVYGGSPMDDYAEGVAMRLRTSSGDYRWFSGRGVPLFDDNGKPDGIAAGLRLVDDLVHERERAVSSESRLEQILDSMLDPHMMLESVRDANGDVCDLEFARANATACRVLGLRHDQLGRV